MLKEEMMKAVFLDRDGVINELIYHQEQGVIDSPFTAAQFRLLSGVGQAIKRLQRNGYLAIIVSNQPGIAKAIISRSVFDSIRRKMHEELAKSGVSLDGEYYCLHHPEAKIDELRIDCDCRKPKPGMLLQASGELDIDLSNSWMVGDNLSDVKAGRGSGCRTVLLGKSKCETCNLMAEECIEPDIIVPNLAQAAEVILHRQEALVTPTDFANTTRKLLFNSRLL